MGKKYELQISFVFPSTEARLRDELVGERYDENCTGDVRYDDIQEIMRVGLGRPIPIKVVVVESNPYGEKLGVNLA